MRVLAVTLALSLSGLMTAHGADAVSYGAPPDWVKPTVTPQADKGMPEAPARVLLRSYQLQFQPRGYEFYSESYIGLQTPQGLQALGNIMLPWKPDTDVLTVHKVRLLRGDQVIDLLANGQAFEVLRRENNLEYAALDGVLTAVLQPAGMEVGDVLNIAFTLRREPGAVGGPEIAITDLAAGPVARIEVRAIWDKSTPLRWKASQDAKGVKEQRQGKGMELTWAADNVEPLTQPLNVPARFWRFPSIDFTVYASWNEVSRTLAPLYAKAAELKADSPLKAEARIIANASADPVVRIESALKLVQDRVRYVFLGMGDGNLNPAAADLTWERRFGDCKGKTALLVALLRELGIQAEPVLVTTAGGDAVPSRLPAMGAFNHVIVRASAGGKTFWLDGTQSGSWRRGELSIPNYHWGLPVSAKGDVLLRMVAEPATVPYIETSTSIDARAGIYTDAPFKAEMRMTGVNGGMVYAQLSQMPQARRDQEMRGYWKKEYDFVDVKTTTVEFDDKAGAAVLRMEGTAKMDWGGGSYTTDGMRVGMFTDYEREPGLNSDAPFVIEHPTYSIARQRIELPEVGKFVTDGDDYDVTLGGAHYFRKSKIENGVFTGETSRRSLATEIGSKEMLEAQKQLHAMWKDRLDIDVSGYHSTDADVAALRTRKYTDRANLVWRGNVFLDRQDYDAAFADFDAAVKADARSADALAHRGLAYYWKKDISKATADFDAALAIDNENAVALRGLGMVQRARGEFAAAVDSFTRSLRSDPGNSFALGNRAYAHSMMEKPDAALADATAAIKATPNYVDMYDLRTALFISQGKDAEALAELQALYAANPGNGAAHWSAAHNFFRLGRYPDAVKAMDQLIADHPVAANYRARSGVRDPADYPARIADMDAALKLEPTSAPYQLIRAQLYSESGNHQAAVDAYTLRLKEEASRVEKHRLRVLRGVEYLKLGNTAAGKQDLNAALRDSLDGDAYNTFCWYVAVGGVELDSALQACDKAVALAPKDAAFLDSRGFVLLRLGRLDEAVAAYEAALALRPGAVSSLYGRGIGKKKRCGCADGDADLLSATRRDPTVARFFGMAGIAP